MRKSAGSSTFALPSEDEPPTPDRQAAREKDVVTTAVSASRKAGKLESNVCTGVVSIYFFYLPDGNRPRLNRAAGALPVYRRSLLIQRPKKRARYQHNISPQCSVTQKDYMPTPATRLHAAP
ncbi:hypothetical protein QQF45_11855 [Halopseudomonas aestusnigri]|uniref:hypothetical protein n=1 Tax=Halopseudomonas aestusnigri TaxID=857252 RepID=UPI0025551FBF|nr:hypothetical protein [Halopseudomonas aestusnigri]MDL2199743.1 hypothetical protein [Halopseudomonas aestusnigri]